MSAKYGVSTYGKEYLLEEGFIEVPPLRYVFIGINILLWIGPTFYLTRKFLGLRSSLKGIARRRQAADALSLLTQTFVAFMVNNALRSSHMIDHILRPVYYHEPKWAYAKYWITEMEIPTYSNIVGVIIMIEGLRGLFRSISQGSRKGLILSLFFMYLYVLYALFNLVHYTIEPPQNYGPFPNFNIAGTAVTTIPLLYCLLKAMLTIPKGKSSQLLSEREEDGSAGVRRSGRKRTPVNRLSS